MYKKIIFPTLIIILLSLNNLFSQDINMGAPQAELGIIAKGYGDSIVVRWIIDKHNLFKIGAKYGYKLERKNLDISNGKFEVIAKKVLPWKDTTWVKFSESITDDKGKVDSMYEFAMYSFFAISQDKDKDPNGGNAVVEDMSNLYAMMLLASTKRKYIPKALGIEFVDKNVDENTNYEYQITFLGKDKTLYEIVSNNAVINSQPISNIEIPYNLVSGDKKIHINISNKHGINGVLYYRSDYENGPWKKLNDIPRLMLYSDDMNDSLIRFSDTLDIINYKTYYYKAIGIDGFGDSTELFKEKTHAVDLTPPKRVFPNPPKHIHNEGYVNISWNFPEKQDSDVEGYNIYRAQSKDGPWKKINDAILSPTTNEFKDYGFYNETQTWYKIITQDTSNNEKPCEPFYAYVYDFKAPETPVWISGEMDSMGVVKLVINSNKERDFMGYRLFMANDPTHEFSPIFENFKDSGGHFIDTVLMDTTTLKTLTESIFYRVKAYDFRFNESPFSEVLEVKRIDTIPPTSPIFSEVFTDDKGIQLHFNPSLSKDVKTMYLLRREDSAKTWTKIIELEKDQKKYTDSKATPGIKYFYCLQSEDESGNKSKLSYPVHSTVYRQNMRDLITNISYDYRKKDQRVTLNWNFDSNQSQGADYWFVVYKSRKDGKMVPLKNTKQEMQYVENLKNLDQYKYSVKVFFDDGTESKMSEIVLVKTDE